MPQCRCAVNTDNSRQTPLVEHGGLADFGSTGRKEDHHGRRECRLGPWNPVHRVPFTSPRHERIVTFLWERNLLIIAYGGTLHLLSDCGGVTASFLFRCFSLHCRGFGCVGGAVDGLLGLRCWLWYIHSVQATRAILVWLVLKAARSGLSSVQFLPFCIVLRRSLALSGGVHQAHRLPFSA